MKTWQEQGGSAFPISDDLIQAGGEVGMSLRDYFAGQAMAAGVERHGAVDYLPAGWDEISEWSYKLADAMLKARGAKAEEQPEAPAKPCGGCNGSGGVIVYGCPGSIEAKRCDDCGGTGEAR